MFKRFKSLAALGHLPKHDERSAKSWLYGKLFVTLLVEKLIGHARPISPWGYELGATTASDIAARSATRPFFRDSGSHHPRWEGS